MINNLKPYKKYKNTHSWLGEIPEHWELRRIKTLLSERVQKGFPDEPLLAATQSKGVIRKDAYGKRTVVAMKDLHLLKLVQKDDFVISLRSFQGGIEYARERGIISSAYTILYTNNPKDHTYLAQFFKSKPFIDGLSIFVTGIREGQNIDYEKLSKAYIPYPPEGEQRAISKFINYINYRIREYIRIKERLYKLLEEQKRNIIYKVITCGVNGSTSLMPLGSIPEHDINSKWKISRLWEISRLRSEKGHSSLDLLSVFLGRGVIRYGEGGGQVHKPSLDLSGYQVVQPGDLVLNNQQAWRGSVGVSEHKGIISPAYVVIDLDESLRSRFADYLFKSTVMVSQFVTASKGVGDIQRDIHMPWLKNIKVPIPSLPEQEKIVEKLDRDLAEIERQQQLFHNEIELLHEFRARIVTDVVTGRLDVREAAEKLPRVETATKLDETEDLSYGTDDEESLEEESEEVEAEIT